MQRGSSSIGFALMGVTGLGPLASGVAHARVGLDGNFSVVNADIGYPPAPPYLVPPIVVNRDPTWVTVWLEDPTVLSGSHLVEADAEAGYHDPFDTTELRDLIPIPFTCAVQGTAAYDAIAGNLHASASALGTLTPSSSVAVAADSRPPTEIPRPYFGSAYGASASTATARSPSPAPRCPSARRSRSS